MPFPAVTPFCTLSAVLRKMDRHIKYAAPAVFLLFAASLAPWAWDFPLNDDWAYALAAKALAETGRLSLSDWGAATQIPHLIWGSLFIKIFGFSFGALRSANVLAAAAAVFAFVKLLEEFDIGPGEKMLAAMALALNPLFLLLASSYMTDLHYLLWMTAAVLFYVRRIKNPGDTRALLLAGCCAAAAYLTRQLGLALPMAFTLVLLLQKKAKWRDLALTWAPPAAAMLGFHLWFSYIHGPTWASANYVGAATLAHLAKPGPFIMDSAHRFFGVLMETGLVLLPLAAGFAFTLRQFWKKNTLERRISSALPWAVLFALGVFIMINGALPYLENNLSSTGIGALTLGGKAAKPSGIFASPLFWNLATALSAAGAAILVCATWLSLLAGGPALRFVFAAAMFHLAISFAGAKFFDRYLLTLLPWFILAAVFAAKGIRFSRAAAFAVLAACAALGWAGVKDYLAWNGAKWELAARPRPGLSPTEIANGFDYEAWLTYERNMAYLKKMKPLKLIGEWEWQRLNNYKALISYASPNPRFQVRDSIEYSTPLSAGKARLYLLALPGPTEKPVVVSY